MHMSAESHSSSSARGLNERDIAVLNFERDWVVRAAGKDEAIRTRLGMSPARYYQLLRELLELRAAIEYDPMLIARLRRLREARMRSRDVRMQPNPQQPEIRDE
jgi:hypothetical protein